MKRLFYLLLTALLLPGQHAYSQNAEPVYEMVETQPEFPGGQQAMYRYLAEHIVYPQDALAQGIEGRPVCQFVVNKDSTISDIALVRSCGTPSLDDEALRVIGEMPKWNPGKQQGQIVRTRFILPVPFRISPAVKANIGEIVGNDADEKVFIVVERMPEFPGGTQALVNFLKENVHYPEDARKAKIEGKTICQFIVDKDGSITDVQVAKSSGNASLDDEALRVIRKMPRWKPGAQKGKPVRVKYTIPINFALK